MIRLHRLDLFPEKETIGSYRNIFSTPHGKEVLVHMLFDLGMFEEVSTPEDMALRNYASRLLKILSGGEVSKDSIQAFSMKLMKQQLMKGSESE